MARKPRVGDWYRNLDRPAEGHHILLVAEEPYGGWLVEHYYTDPKFADRYNGTTTSFNPFSALTGGHFQLNNP